MDRKECYGKNKEVLTEFRLSMPRAGQGEDRKLRTLGSAHWSRQSLTMPIKMVKKRYGR